MTTTPSRARPLFKLALSLGVFLVAASLVELGSRVWARANGQPYSASQTRQAITEVVTTMTGSLPGIVDDRPEDEKKAGVPMTLHPFAGYDSTAGLVRQESVIAHYRDPQEESLTIFLQGGSVAAILAGTKLGAPDRLIEPLEAHPAVDGKVRLLRFCTPGFKQPQQLCQLAYLLARGCRPDFVINLDGNNEIRLAMRNADLGVDPTWPSVAHWSRVTQGNMFDTVTLDLLLEVRTLQARALEVASQGERWHLIDSCLLGNRILSRLRNLQSRWAAAQEAYVAHLVDSGKERGELGLGLPFKADDALRIAVDCWYEASLAMFHLCNSRGIHYLHVLQPTLHDPDSGKPITEEEWAKGIGEEGMTPDMAEGYRMMRERLGQLAAQGVHVLDATRVFAGIDETLYYDKCHFGRRGNELLADLISEELVSALED